MSKTKIQITVSIEQAQAIEKALDVYSRLTMGQFSIITEMVMYGSIPLFAENGKPVNPLLIETCNKVRENIKEVGKLLGYKNGVNLGIGNRHMPMNGLRTYEVSRVLNKTLAEYINPNPSFKGVEYDGLILRYTSDEIPEVNLFNVVESKQRLVDDDLHGDTRKIMIGT